jgi:hypothetical protein
MNERPLPHCRVNRWRTKGPFIIPHFHRLVAAAADRWLSTAVSKKSKKYFLIVALSI